MSESIVILTDRDWIFIQDHELSPDQKAKLKALLTGYPLTEVDR